MGRRRGGLLGGHLRLQIDSQGVGQAIDVVEVADDVRGHEDVLVVEADLAQGFDIAKPASLGSARQFDGVIQEPPNAIGERRRAVVAFERVGQGVIAGSGTEILPVRLRSVVARIGSRDNRGEHLALGAAQTRGRVHESHIELHENPIHARAQGGQLDDLVHLAGPLDRFFVLAREIARGFIGLDGANVGQDSSGRPSGAPQRSAPDPAR